MDKVQSQKVDNSGYCIQKCLDKHLSGYGRWKTISAAQPLDTTMDHLAKLEKRNPNSAFRIFFDAPDLMKVGAICEG